jgi:hypothetical protein
MASPLILSHKLLLADLKHHPEPGCTAGAKDRHPTVITILLFLLTLKFLIFKKIKFRTPFIPGVIMSILARTSDP